MLTKEQRLSQIQNLIYYLYYYLQGKEPTSIEEAREFIMDRPRTWKWYGFAMFSGIDVYYARKTYSMHLKRKPPKIDQEDIHYLNAQSREFLIRTGRLPTYEEVMHFRVSSGFPPKNRAQTYAYNLLNRTFVQSIIEGSSERFIEKQAPKVLEPSEIVDLLRV